MVGTRLSSSSKKKVLPMKAAPKKTAPKKAAPKKATPKKMAAPKKMAKPATKLVPSKKAAPTTKKAATKSSGGWDKKDPRGKRPSPTASATSFPVGHEQVGNDGLQYVIRADKNGKPSWKKA